MAKRNLGPLSRQNLGGERVLEEEGEELQLRRGAARPFPSHQFRLCLGKVLALWASL